MSRLQALRNNGVLRRPMLFALARLLRPAAGGAGFWSRAFYDAMPVRHLIAGSAELFVVSTTDKVIGRQLFLRGEFDFDKLVVAIGVLERHGRNRPVHLIDVGANIGSVVIPAIKRGLVATATAIEPHPENLRLLRTNLALNEVDGFVSVLGFAISDCGATVLTLQESDFNSGNHSIGASGIPVPSMRLDDLGLPSGDALLWMDIEGYEGHALRGATTMLAQGIPVVSEFNPSFLRAAGGLDAFSSILGNRRIFDLRFPSTATSIESLIGDYADGYTDILAI